MSGTILIFCLHIRARSSSFLHCFLLFLSRSLSEKATSCPSCSSFLSAPPAICENTQKTLSVCLHLE